MDEWVTQLRALLQNDWVAVAITVVAILLVTFLVSRIVAKFLRAILQSDDNKFLPANSIFVNIARATIWVIGVCVILATCFSVDVSAVIAALGIGGIALSLGFQDTISNLIGGLQVSLMKILKPGDHIQVGSDSGIVKDVTWRHTSIKNSLGQTVIIPNATINKTALTKLPPANQITLNFAISLTEASLDTVVHEIEQACIKAAASISVITQAPHVRFTEITESGIKGKVVFRIAKAQLASEVSDAALRLIAPLTRP